MLWFYLLLIFLCVAASVAACYFAFVDYKLRADHRTTRRIGELAGAPVAAEDVPALFKSVDEFELPPAPGQERMIDTVWASLTRDWLRPLRQALELIGAKAKPAHVLTISGILAVLAGVAGWLVQGFLLGVPAALAGMVAPVAYVFWKAAAHREKFLSQLPGAFELMARVIRSGQSVPQAFQSVADSFENPIAAAFARCRDQQNMGLAPEIAFQELAEQSGVLDMRIFVMSMMLQRTVGGNLSEVLERLATLVRDRRKIHMQVQTLTAEGRLQAGILLVLPLFMLIALRFVNRAYADELFQYPGLLAATGVAMLVGALWIRQIIKIEV